VKRALLPLLALLLLAAGPDGGPEGAVVASGFARVVGGDTFPAPKLDVPVVNNNADMPDLQDVIKRTTVLFYYSATCPHCQDVAPEMAELSKRRTDLDVIGIASGSNSLSDIEAFAKDYGCDFPMYKDYTKRFASANQARSTPTVWVVRPTADGFETLEEYRPFSRGMGTLLEMRLASAEGKDPWTGFPKDRYAGAVVCAACHLQENASWGLTHHSVAYWTLYEREKNEDAACVGCHVTGLGTESGFKIGDHGSPLADVTCEACHGMGGPHGAERRPAKQAAEVCVTCHDADHSISFDVERGLPHIDHWRAVSLDAEGFRKAREDLVEGRAPKPLLAFPEGTNQGNGACQNCHPVQAQSWAKTPHAHAMKTLKARGSHKDPACIRCHAVAKVDAPKAPKDWHGDSVGCEACHGPGEKHVAAAGGTDNIVGLGESCPECVIESICTTCHTPEQDPDWDLEKALKKVKH
jgi:peroxiredoxin